MIKFHLLEYPEGTQPIIPKRATKGSAGYDLYSPINYLLRSGETVKIDTYVAIELDSDMAFVMYIRSSLAAKGIVLTAGCNVIDSDYYNNPTNGGNMGLVLTNTSDEDYQICQGERLAQGVIINYYVTDDDNCTKERVGGYGSTSIKADE